MTVVPVTSAGLDAAEVSWFAALCDDDYEYLGVPEPHLQSSYRHCAEIVRRADVGGRTTYWCPAHQT